MNIRFSYLYRDAGNYKNWADIVLTNPCDVSLGDLTQQIEEILISGLYFVASKAKVHDLHFPDFDEELDHGWHEFYALEYTLDHPTDAFGRDIDKLLIDLIQAAL